MVKVLQVLHHSNNYFFVDLETSKPCPISGGLIKIAIIATDSDFEVLETKVWSVKPPIFLKQHWSEKGQEFHGIPFEDVLGFMDNRQFCYEFLMFMKKYKCENNTALNFVCHASHTGFFNMEEKERVWPWIDFTFLEWAMRKEGYEYSFWKVFRHEGLISTIKMARDMGFKGNKLNQWAERIGFKLDHHDPLSDAFCCLELYKYLLNYGIGASNDEKPSRKKSRKTKKNNANLSLGI